jgi:hypothetical protein
MDGTLANDRALSLDITGWKRTHSISWPQSDKAANELSDTNAELYAELYAALFPAPGKMYLTRGLEDSYYLPTRTLPTLPRRNRDESRPNPACQATDGVRLTSVHQDPLVRMTRVAAPRLAVDALYCIPRVVSIMWAISWLTTNRRRSSL